MRTDHSSLTWLINFKEPQGQLARWIEELSQYDLIIKHRPDKQHSNADALSRKPGKDGVCKEYRLDKELAYLPCGGCQYCQRAHRNWSEFVAEVDDVVPLSRHLNRGVGQGESSRAVAPLMGL